MLDSKQISIDVLENPASIQIMMLEELQNRLLGGEVIQDGNNVLTFILEMVSTLTSDSINTVHDTLRSVYPVRSKTSSDLYKHMSTWDYVNLFSKPAETTIGIFLDLDYIIKNAESVNSNYSKIVFPENTIFNIGSYSFGIYYPIEIRINRTTHEILCVWDTSQDNPLYMLTQNTISHHIRSINGVKGLFVTIHAHQFTRTVISETVDTTIGFRKEYSYDDKFYAIRLYYETPTGEWKEAKQTLSEDVYDTYNVTARLMVSTEHNNVTVSIPQIYFDKGYIGSNIKIELYDTKGELNMDIVGVDPSVYSLNLGKHTIPSSMKFSKIINHIPTLKLVPASSKIIGGSNGLTFNELKERVINNSFYSDVLISNDELTKYFKDIGFNVTKYIDDITDRIYFCRKVITSTDGDMVGSADISTKFDMEHIENCSTILNDSSGTAITILPDTLFKYDFNTNTCQPLTDVELETLNNKPISEKLRILNDVNSLYTTTPFHIRLETSDKYPVAHSYDLLKPEIIKTEFMWESEKLFSQVSIGNVVISPINNGRDGYTILFTAYPSDNIKARISSESGFDLYDLDNFAMVCMLNGRTQIARPAGKIDDNKYLFAIDIKTNYRLTREHKIDTSSFVADDGDTLSYMNLTEDITITAFIKKTSLDETLERGETLGYPNRIPNMVSDYLPLTEFKTTVKLGRRITEMFNEVNITYTDIEYTTYPNDVFAKYNEDIFKRDENGVPVYTVENGDIVLSYEHREGDWIFKDNPDVITHIAENADADSVFVKVYNASNIQIGFGVYGEFIAQDTVVVGVDYDTNTIELNRPVLQALTENTDILVGELVLVHAKGTRVTYDGTNDVVKQREHIYNVNLIHIDGTSLYTDSLKHRAVVDDVRETLRVYFNTINASRDQLLCQTRLYFKPTRTIGIGEFKSSLTTIYSMNVQFSIAMRLFVSGYTYSSKDILNNIKSVILRLITEQLQSGTISTSQLAEDIKDELDGVVKYVDMLGFNGDKNLHTLIPANEYTTPSLAKRLVLVNGGVVSEDALDIEFITI